MKEIVNRLFSEIINEACQVKPIGYFNRNIVFNAIVEGREYKANLNLGIPTLIINDKNKFNDLLLNYVVLAYDHYYQYIDNYREIYDLDGNIIEESDRVVNERYIKDIIATLFSNATDFDFMNPILFLEKRINMFSDGLTYNNYLGEFFGMPLVVNKKAEKLENETPYSFEFKIGDNVLPIVRYGIVGNKAYVYAIQNKKIIDDKKLKRNLYKLNSGFDDSNESDDNIEDFGNLKGITPSFMASLTIALGILYHNDVAELEVPTFLPLRLNAKLMKTGEVDENNLRNFIDKFIRHFSRLSHQFTGLKIISYPMDLDSSYHFSISDGEFSNSYL